MKTHKKFITAATALMVLLSLVGFAWPCAAQLIPNPLTLPDGYTQGAAYGVNASGQVFGLVGTTPQPSDACVWTDGTPTVLPYPDGYRNAHANGVNASGVVVGCVEADTEPYFDLAVRWTPNGDGTYAVEDLGFTPEDEGVSSEAFAINDQGQILCQWAGDFYLWEDGAPPTITMITDDSGHHINATAYSIFGPIGLLASDGRVAGTVSAGYQTPLHVVLWQKTETGITVTDLASSDNGAGVDAMSPNGVVAGWSNGDEYGGGGDFLYDSNSGSTTYLASPPADNGSVIYIPGPVESVNDQGQAVYSVSAVDTESGAYTDQLWIWQASSDTWTQVPVDSLSIPTGYQVWALLALINNNGQVAGAAIAGSETDESTIAIGFAWSTGTGTEELGPPSGTDYALALALNDSGLAVGAGVADDYSLELPATWNLPGLASALDITDVTATSPSSHSPLVTVNVLIGNPNEEVAYDVTVTAASLGGVDTNSRLPLVYGAIKPDDSKKCTLQFKNVPSGEQMLSVEGASSLGDFFIEQTINVP